MAVSYDQLVARVKQQLLGYTKDQASVSFLTAPMAATDTTFTVDTSTITTALSRGLIEIDDEIIWVNKYDRQSGIVQVMAGLNGRGVEGSVAASHSVNAIVTDDPQFPKIRIKEAINDTIRALYPDLYIFDFFEFPKIAARYEYPIPAAVEDVYKVTFNTIGPSALWQPAQRWRFATDASTTAGQVKPTPAPTGKTLQISDDIVPGRNIRVSYIKSPNVLVNGSDDFATVTGYPERYVDLVTYGACWRLLPAYEASRLQQGAIEANERAPLVQTGAASQATQFFLALYTKRLNDERDRLERLFERFQNFNS